MRLFVISWLVFTASCFAGELPTSTAKPTPGLASHADCFSLPAHQVCLLGDSSTAGDEENGAEDFLPTSIAKQLVPRIEVFLSSGAFLRIRESSPFNPLQSRAPPTLL